MINKEFLNCVYRFLDEYNKIIYIGKAKNLKNRMNNHSHLNSECYNEVKIIQYTSFESEADMDIAERYYIAKYKPKYNTLLKKDVSVNIETFDFAEWKVYCKDKKEKEYYDGRIILTTDLINKYDKYENRLNDIKKEIEKKYIEINTLNSLERNDSIRNLIEIKNKDIDKLYKEKKRISKELLIIKVGREEFNKFEWWEQDLYIQYKTTDRKEIINLKINEIVDDICRYIRFTIKSNEYCEITELLYLITNFFSYVGNQDKFWLEFIEEGFLKKGEEFTGLNNCEVNEIEKYVMEVYNKAKLKLEIEDDFNLIEEVIMKKKKINLLSNLKIEQPIKVLKIK